MKTLILKHFRQFIDREITARESKIDESISSTGSDVIRTFTAHVLT